jgi:hypothetical protein
VKVPSLPDTVSPTSILHQEIPVAVKKLTVATDENGKMASNALAEFIQEVEVQGALDHPNIVAVFGVYSCVLLLYDVSSYLAGIVMSPFCLIMEFLQYVVGSILLTHVLLSA